METEEKKKTKDETPALGDGMGESRTVHSVPSPLPAFSPVR